MIGPATATSSMAADTWSTTTEVWLTAARKAAVRAWGMTGFVQVLVGLRYVWGINAKRGVPAPKAQIVD